MKLKRALTFAIAVAVSIMCITPALAVAEDSRQSDHLETEDLTALCRDSGIAYGIDIASDFGGIPNDYTAYYNIIVK